MCIELNYLPPCYRPHGRNACLCDLERCRPVITTNLLNLQAHGYLCSVFITICMGGSYCPTVCQKQYLVSENEISPLFVFKNSIFKIKLIFTIAVIHSKIFVIYRPVDRKEECMNHTERKMRLLRPPSRCFASGGWI